MSWASPEGIAAVDGWLHEPVEHVRELRSQLLMKLALLHRRGIAASGLLERQRALLQPVVESLRAEQATTDGFDAVLVRWRYTTANAALEFVAALQGE
ncbi:hypothetical protein [Pseudonocardia sp. GCM10023141]|uniref:hypothetical protein n=1 Tax=Pseudonocardia sp. GCM10023141 TaxID=3252653 RepID=UPI003609AD70